MMGRTRWLNMANQKYKNLIKYSKKITGKKIFFMEYKINYVHSVNYKKIKLFQNK